MRIVVDTSVLIDHLRGDPRALALLTEAAKARHELWSVAVVRTEILAGMREGEGPATRILLKALKWQEVSVALADRAGDLARKYMRAHPGVDTVDYLVGATALTLHARLYTLNVKHFPMMKDLAPAYR